MEDQREVRAFLAKPSSHGLAAGETVEQIETHISVVFLAGEHAFKLKKPVLMSYLDFSTCALRKAACEQELMLNRRTAPEIYEKILPIRRAVDGLHLGGETGGIIDWLVVMRRFDNQGLLARMAEEGTLDAALIGQVAIEAARLHETAERHPEAGGADVLRAVAASNLRSFEPAMGKVLPRPAILALHAQTLAAIASHEALLEHRRRAGFVRRCHGDLHLGNIVRIGDRPVLFDCIEFNDAFSTIDVLYDLAFLLMDLAFRAAADARLAGLANRALNVWLDHIAMPETGAMLEGLAAMPLFISLRAAIRSHVDAHDAARADRARAYLAFAEVALKPGRPRLVAVGGLSGTGKSTLARGLAPLLGGEVDGALGAVHLRSDVLRKKMWGVPLLEPLPAEAYTQEAGDRVYRELFRLAGLALRAGFPVVLDAVFARPWERDAAEEAARAAGVPFQGIWLEAGQAVLEARVENRAMLRTDSSDADAAVVRRQMAYDTGDIGWRRLESEGEPPDVLQRARAILPL